jgi:hypothetical protein
MTQSGEGDRAVLARMQAINQALSELELRKRDMTADEARGSGKAIRVLEQLAECATRLPAALESWRGRAPRYAIRQAR